MTGLLYIVPALVVGVCSAAGALFCWFALRKQAEALRMDQANLRSALESAIEAQSAECNAKLGQVAEAVAVLEVSTQALDRVGSGALTRSTRSQAMQLLRSGAQPDSIASTLAIGKREMRLIAGVSRELMLK